MSAASVADCIECRLHQKPRLVVLRIKPCLVFGPVRLAATDGVAHNAVIALVDARDFLALDNANIVFPLDHNHHTSPAPRRDSAPSPICAAAWPALSATSA